MQLRHSAYLRMPLTNGNDGRGTTWFPTAKVRREFAEYLASEKLKRQPFEHPVSLRIVRLIGRKQRRFDEDSLLRGNSKELIDALVEAGWFKDDSPKYILQVLGSQELDRENGAAIRVEVYDDYFFKG